MGARWDRTGRRIAARTGRRIAARTGRRIAARTGRRIAALEGAAEIGERRRYHGAFARERIGHLFANEGEQLFPDLAAQIPGLRCCSGADQRSKLDRPRAWLGPREVDHCAIARFGLARGLFSPLSDPRAIAPAGDTK